jgi:hypothetical protein
MIQGLRERMLALARERPRYGIGVSRRRFHAGECNAARLRSAMADVLAREPRARTDYVSAADPLALRELERVEAGALVSLAVRIGSTPPHRQRAALGRRPLLPLHGAGDRPGRRLAGGTPLDAPNKRAVADRHWPVGQIARDESWLCFRARRDSRGLGGRR